MKFRWVKTNWLIKALFPNYIWDLPNNENKIYLTFDDGPTPEITEWTLAQLKKYNAKATFFCIGNNIRKFPAIFQKIQEDGHSIGNHTFNHLNSWKNSKVDYLENTALCQSEIHNLQPKTPNSKLQTFNLFRPPYGKIKSTQAKTLRKLGYKIIMWDIISYDFDKTISPEECLNTILKNAKTGSIIVFHDSIKAFPNLESVLPKVLENLNKRGFVFDKI